jgi:hypothetical protein
MQRVAKTGRGSIGEREGAPATEGEIERVCTAYRLFLHRVEAASSRPTCANRLFYFAIRRSLFRLTFGTVRTVRGVLVSKSTTRVIKTRLQEKRVRGIGPEAAFQETRLPYGCPTIASNWAAMASNSLHSSWIACISACGC